MLSRTAENLYWLARYVDARRVSRAHHRCDAARYRASGYLYRQDQRVGFGAIDRGRQRKLLRSLRGGRRTQRRDYLSFSPSNPSSIRNCIENARLNSRSVRTALTSEMWEHHQFGLDRTSGGLGQRHQDPRGPGEVFAFRAGNLAAFRRLGLSHHAAQRTPTGSHGSDCISSAPTTPPASST